MAFDWTRIAFLVAAIALLILVIGRSSIRRKLDDRDTPPDRRRNPWDNIR